MFYYGGLDLTYLVFAVPALLLGLWAQSAVKKPFFKIRQNFDKKRHNRSSGGGNFA